jgi:hypothetical protein
VHPLLVESCGDARRRAVIGATRRPWKLRCDRCDSRRTRSKSGAAERRFLRRWIQHGDVTVGSSRCELGERDAEVGIAAIAIGSRSRRVSLSTIQRAAQSCGVGARIGMRSDPCVQPIIIAGPPQGCMADRSLRSQASGEGTGRVLQYVTAHGSKRPVDVSASIDGLCAPACSEPGWGTRGCPTIPIGGSGVFRGRRGRHGDSEPRAPRYSSRRDTGRAIHVPHRSSHVWP